MRVTTKTIPFIRSCDVIPLLIIFLLSMFVVEQPRDIRQFAAQVSTLEAKNGILSGNVSLSTDQNASRRKYIVFSSLTHISLTPTLPSQDAVALTPPMGYNQYGRFHDNVTSQLIRSLADGLVTSGLRNVGYRIIQIDDSWTNNGPRTDNNKALQPNSNFKDITQLSKDLHTKGFIFGVYTSPGATTCGGHQGTPDNDIDKDVQEFAGWQVDYIKLDWCRTRPYNVDEYTKVARLWQAAITKYEHPMILGISTGASPMPSSVRNSVDKLLWGVGMDVCSTWKNLGNGQPESDALGCFDHQYHAGIYDIIANPQARTQIQQSSSVAGPAHWEDPDMVQVGNPGLSFEEAKTNFSMWAIWSASLLLANDPRYLTVAFHGQSYNAGDILKNKEAIAIDQDPLVKTGIKKFDQNSTEIWIKPLQNNTYALVLLNLNDTPTTITANWTQLGLQTTVHVRDIWQHQDKGIIKNSYSAMVPAHGVVMLTVK